MKKIILSVFLTIFFLTSLTLVLSGKKIEKIAKFNGDTSVEEKTPTNDVLQRKLEKINGKEIIVKLYRSKQGKVIDLSLEAYVLGVVSAEMPAEFPVEAIKAQAVAARTYVLAHMEAFGGVSSPAANGGNVIDTTANQVYYSKDERMAGWPAKKQSEYWNKISSAVKETEGQVLTYDGDLVMQPYFFSTSGGKTENGSDVFETSVPYLKSVDSGGEESSPKFKNDVKISKSDFINKINASYSGALDSSASLEKNISIISRGEGGVIKEIKVGKATISGSNFRKIYNLNSADFEITYSNSNVVITTNGYGHGVGMSQFGAKAMAQGGSDYLSILTYYYTGVNVEKINIGDKKITRIK